MKKTWIEQPIPEIADRLATDADLGLSPQEASKRLAQQGPNELRKAKGISPLMLFLGQFKSLVIWVLIGAALVSIALGEWVDGSAILAIVILNAVIGFFQEYRAGKAAAALARLTTPKARVVRDGHAAVVAAAEIVSGDILLLEAGDLVAADARLLDTSQLRANEAPLTGESQSVEKRVAMLPKETPLADRHNMVFLGTSIVGGSGRALVVATGMDTEVGHIAQLLQSAGADETPLQRRLDKVGRRLLWICLGIVALVFGLGLLRGNDPFELFRTAISLAVAAIPEGLPAVVTVALALGVQRMVRRNALVRRLPSVETLGCAQVICTDKTGTLTVGAMTARKIVTQERLFSVTGEGYQPSGVFISGGREQRDDPALFALLWAATACNDAELTDGRPSIVGDPTEGALLVAAMKWGIRRVTVETEMPRVAVVPFDSDRKRMTVIRRWEEETRAFVKGAPEVILERCAFIRTREGIIPMTAEERAAMIRAGDLLAGDALRVLAIAERVLESFPSDPSAPLDEAEIEQDLVLLGLVGLQDPPRGEVRDAIAKCKRAGIKTVMITGDHPDTAKAIAHELGILDNEDEVALGAELEMMSDDELQEQVRRIAVYARVTAEHKLRIVRAWKATGAVVAMTGDGVNDAPALKEASIGIAMGITGTEVTKETADLIITDDNFASIVAAIEEGRGIYDNIAKTLAYLLFAAAAELAIMLFAALVGWPSPLLPLHLLWINLVTGGLPALALATDPIDTDVLSRPPRSPQAELLDRKFLKLTLLTGFLTASVSFGAFAYEFYRGTSLDQARDAAFTALVIAELIRSFGARSRYRTVWQLGLFTNLRLCLIVAASFALQLAIHHIPALQTLFGTEPITLYQCTAWFGLGFIPLLVLEALKVRRQFRERRTALSAEMSANHRGSWR
ncbi:cation-translocating P-type ATPase [Methylococcus sp. EFPC2]|uniref:cation-translocating P-type ATPase n=1 Tax=Methylococcus sp. EFPC2 TaxID=2812648 RepID=UPI0019674455|nr:cation-translocating P-type ATPase [Methylococcus sp. EFPC2]QSA98098.1 cation-translocating P-type ATPase [Methylococcus sp. EFPC2]